MWKNGTFCGKGTLTTDDYEYTGQFNSELEPEGYGERAWNDENKF